MSDLPSDVEWLLPMPNQRQPTPQPQIQGGEGVQWALPMPSGQHDQPPNGGPSCMLVKGWPRHQREHGLRNPDQLRAAQYRRQAILVRRSADAMKNPLLRTRIARSE